MRIALHSGLNQANRCLLLLLCPSFMVGAILAFYFADSIVAPWLPGLFATVLCIAAALYWFFFSSAHQVLAALPLFLLLGFFHTAQALAPPSDPQHLFHATQQPVKASLAGRVAGMIEYDGETSRFILDTHAVLVHGNKPEQQAGFQPVRGKAQIYVRGPLEDDIVPGQAVLLLGQLEPMRTPQQPGAGAQHLLFAAKGLHCSLWMNGETELLRLQAPAPAWRQRIILGPEKLRQRLAAFLLQGLERNTAGVYQALLIGSLTQAPAQIIEQFKNCGCMHILSISGLHVSLLSLASLFVLTRLLRRSTWLLLHAHVASLALGITAVLLVVYTCLAGLNIPALRALFTALLALAAVLLRRRRSLPYLIAGAALILLAINPLALFTASFQLSFSAVLAIYLITPRLPFFSEAGKGKSGAARYMSMIQAMLLVSVAASLGTLPFMLYHFNRFSLIGPLANLLIEPLLCLWALPVGLLALPLVFVWPQAALILFKLGGLGIQAALWLVARMADAPLASIWTITPYPVEMILFFLILALLLWPSGPRRVKRWASASALALGLHFTASLWLDAKSTETRIHFIDVGQGSCALLELPSGRRILLDGGGRESERFHPGERIIAPFLWKKRIWRLDSLIISHPHKDHYNGLDFIFARFAPAEVWINDDPGDEEGYHHLLAMIRQAGIRPRPAQGPQSLWREDGLRLDSLGLGEASAAQAAWRGNERSLVLRLQHQERAFLFPADAQRQREKALLAKYHDHAAVQADVLLAGHHGSITSSSREFIEALAPQVIVVSASAANKKAHPAPAHLQDWRKQGKIILTTAEQGTITVISDGRRLCVQPSAAASFCVPKTGSIGSGEKGNEAIKPQQQPPAVREGSILVSGQTNARSPQ